MTKQEIINFLNENKKQTELTEIEMELGQCINDFFNVYIYKRCYNRKFSFNLELEYENIIEQLKLNKKIFIRCFKKILKIHCNDFQTSRDIFYILELIENIFNIDIEY